MFFKKNKKDNNILFYPASETIAKFIEPPKTASSSNIPDWHKKLPKYMYGAKKFVFNDGVNLSAKSCLPLTDMFTCGYVFTLPCDVYTSKHDDGSRFFSWAFKNYDVSDPVVKRPEHNKEELTGWRQMDGYEDLEFNWWPYWSIKTPPGYSSLLIHPVNRTDLPFYTIGGILDTDRWGEAGNHPFLIKKDWEGTISAGTPIIQIIPFKRENWTSTIDKSMTDEYTKNIANKNIFLQGYYKTKIWKSKNYK
jgi:hypothetical protein